MNHAVIDFTVAIVCGFSAAMPHPPTAGFGVGLFGRPIMSWPTTNALLYTFAIINFVDGLRWVFLTP